MPTQTNALGTANEFIARHIGPRDADTRPCSTCSATPTWKP